MSTLFASDLDRTLIFSPAASERLGGALPARDVEVLDGVVISTMAESVWRGLAALPVVPVTTRTVAQLRRVAWPCAQAYAVAASGGTVLVGGVPDPSWSATVTASLAGAQPLAAMTALLADATGERVRVADDLFCYTITDATDPVVDGLESPCAAGGWRVERQGRKLYLLPLALDKAAAVAYVADRAGADRVLAAGDSLLDRTMVEAADVGWVPRGSPLADGPLPAHVIVTREPGHAAAAEITAAWAARA